MKAAKAQSEGRFDEEIVAVEIPQRKKDSIIFSKDEFIKTNTTTEILGKLRAAFKKEGGTVTAGNASGINDGAAALVIMKYEEAQNRGLSPLAKIVSWGQAGVDPRIMGIGPVEASNKALKKAGLTIDDMDVIELNEAFAAQACAVNKLGIPEDKLNVNGGAIALGHPIGASGARILVTLLHEMIRQNKSKGCATLCIGGGMGIAMCIQRYN